MYARKSRNTAGVRSPRTLGAVLPPRRQGQSKADYFAAILAELDHGIAWLMARHGVPTHHPNALKLLILILASEVYGGTPPPKPGGVIRQPTKTIDDLILWGGVELTRRRAPGLTVRQIIGRLKKRNSWDVSPSTLYRRYYTLRNPVTREHKAAVALARILMAQLQNTLRQAS